MKITISVENPELTYFVGQVIQGAVILDNPSEAKTVGLKIKCFGVGKVEWAERRGKYTTYRKDSQNYICCKTYLIGSKGGPEITIPAGTHHYPFVFQLPRSIPSSFFSKYGHISYYLQATLKRSEAALKRFVMGKFNADTRLYFSVNGIVDLNTATITGVGAIDQPIQLANEKTLGFCFYNSRPISFKLTVNQGGFVSGQRLHYSLQVSNLSNRKVRSCVVTLFQGVTYKVRSHIKMKNYVIKKCKHPEVPSGEERCWPENCFTIPSLPPTGLGGCHLMDLLYYIEVKVKVFTRSSLKGELPVVIGSIPLRSHFNSDSRAMPMSMPSTMQRNVTSQSSSVNNVQSIGSLESYTALPPPTYEEVFGKCPSYEQVELEELETESRLYLQNRSFVPKYANYRFRN